MFDVNFEDKTGKACIVNAADVRDAKPQNKHLGRDPKTGGDYPAELRAIGPLVRLELRDGRAVTVKGTEKAVTAAIRKALGGA